MIEATTISILSLITAIIVAVVGFLRGGRAEVERYQKLTDSVDTATSGIEDLKDMVSRMDAKLDRHDVEIVRMEARLEEHDRRLTHIEGRCERHFGISQHVEDGEQ